MLASEVSGNKKAIVINPENNECYKQDKQDQINYCQTLALVKCFGNENDICSFKILPSINDQAIFMSPKKTYYNILAKGKVDLYEISVEDEEVSSIVVVLTSVTGDAELQVVKNSEQNTPTPGTPPTGIQSKISRNKDYIPDVVRITPNLLGAKSVVGKYTVKITSVSFSSYNLYYYTTRIKSKDEQPALKDITLSLSEGNIIKDYFPNDISYKIFSYTPQSKEKEGTFLTEPPNKKKETQQNPQAVQIQEQLQKQATLLKQIQDAEERLKLTQEQRKKVVSTKRQEIEKMM